MTTEPMVADVRVWRLITVDVDPEQAFRVFTEGIDGWWIRSHHIGSSAPFTVILESEEGGRWYERGADGSECNWGRVLAWEPPGRLVLAWQITPDWTYDPDFATEVEVRFIREAAERTRVELEHRGLERYGERATEMRTIFESPGGWTGLLEAYAASAPARR